MANKPMTFRPASDELEVRIDKKVEEMGVSRNSYLNDAIEFYSGFDPKFLLGLKGTAASMNISPVDLLQRLFASWAGRIDAHYETVGYMPVALFDVSTQGDFEGDYQMHKQREILKLEKELVAQGLEDEAYGTELDENVKKLMVKYRQGRAWLESEECKQQVEMQKYLEENFPDVIKMKVER